MAVFKESPGGPFFSDPQSENYVRPQSGYLLTKTHCGGRCDQCPPNKYIENQHTFSRCCFDGDHIAKGDNNVPIRVMGSYSQDLLARAVHIIRDPLDNIVSRFHLTYKHFVEEESYRATDTLPQIQRGIPRVL